MKSVKRTNENLECIDLTPMLDVVFIMLIFFVVTASFIKEHAVKINPSPEHSSITSDLEPAVITVTSNNRLLMDNRNIEVGALRSLISQKTSIGGKDTSIVINAHEQSTTEMYVAIVDAAHQSNVHAVSLRTYASN